MRLECLQQMDVVHTLWTHQDDLVLSSLPWIVWRMDHWPDAERTASIYPPPKQQQAVPEWQALSQSTLPSHCHIATPYDFPARPLLTAMASKVAAASLEL